MFKLIKLFLVGGKMPHYGTLHFPDPTTEKQSKKSQRYSSRHGLPVDFRLSSDYPEPVRIHRAPEPHETLFYGPSKDPSKADNCCTIL